MNIGLLFNQPLGAQVAPIGNFAPKRELATGAIIGAAAIGAASNLYSQYQNLKSQSNTNETNYKIWQEQLAAQRENWKREQENYLQNRRWQLQDMASERNWNSVQSQVARYRAAGLNPALAMYGGAGQNQTTTSQATPSQPTFSSPGSAPQMIAPQMDLSGLGITANNALNLYLASQKTETDMQVAKQHADNESFRVASEVMRNHVQNKYTQALVRQVVQQTRFDNEAWAERFEGVKLANQAIRVDMELKQEQVKFQKIMNDFKPKENEKILRNLDKNMEQIESAIRKNDADSAYSYALKSLTDSQREGVDMDNATKFEMAESIVAQKSAEADLADFKAQQEGKYLESGDVFGRLSPRGYNPSTGKKTDYRSRRSSSRRIPYKGSDGKYHFKNSDVGPGGTR